MSVKTWRLSFGIEKEPSHWATTYPAADRPTTGTIKDSYKSLFSGLRAVVVEDEGVTKLQLKKILRAHGIQVVGEASNGRDAIEVAQTTKPDLILMDVRMPVMDGLEASRRIIARCPTCIVMLTAFSDDECQREAHEIGASGYAVKPVTTETLAVEVASALKRFRQQQQPQNLPANHSSPQQ